MIDFIPVRSIRLAPQKEYAREFAKRLEDTDRFYFDICLSEFSFLAKQNGINRKTTIYPYPQLNLAIEKHVKYAYKMFSDFDKANGVFELTVIGMKPPCIVEKNIYPYRTNQLEIGSVNTLQFYHNFDSYEELQDYARRSDYYQKKRYSGTMRIIYLTVASLNKWVKTKRKDYDSKTEWLEDGFKYVTKILNLRSPDISYNTSSTLPIKVNHIDGNYRLVEIVTSLMTKYLIEAWNDSRNLEFYRELQAAKGKLGGQKRKGKPSNNRLRDTDTLKQQLYSMKEESPKMTQRELATAVGVSLGTVNKWLKELSKNDHDELSG